MAITKSKRMLSFKEMFALTNLVKDEYTKSDMSDERFAAYASEKMELDISRSSVVNARETLDIPSHKAAKRTASGRPILERLDELEAAKRVDDRRITELEKQFSVWRSGTPYGK